MSSGFKPGDSRPEPQSEASSPERPAELVAGARMLEQILSATAGGPPKDGTQEPEEIRALRTVAKAHSGMPFVLQPVAVEMIHSILQIQFKLAGIPRQTVEAMAKHIATTLYHDPPSRERLQALWSSLSET